MKTLYIVRHAKSSWEHTGLSDEERPLLEKGRKRTEKVAGFLVKKGICPELIISSPAVRALDTARILAGVLGYPLENIFVSEMIYHAGADRLFDQLFEIDDDVDNVMIVGHNPAFTSFANYFLDNKIDWLPTSGVVSVTIDTDNWEHLPASGRKTNFVIYPKDL